MSATSARRPAFTLIEMARLAIIGVPISLLLPAIQASRAGPAGPVRDNLMQLGTALANYHASHSVLPPGVVNDRGPVTARPGGYRFGWAVQILPYLGQSTVYQEFDFRSGIDAAANATRQHRLHTFLCPSSVAPGNMSYAACHHDVEWPIDADNHGVFDLIAARATTTSPTERPSRSSWASWACPRVRVAGPWRSGHAPQHGDPGQRRCRLRPLSPDSQSRPSRTTMRRPPRKRPWPARSSADSVAFTRAEAISYSATARCGSFCPQRIPWSIGGWGIGPTGR